jgi:Cdc6-like AAA superfamily ATPase
LSILIKDESINCLVSFDTNDDFMTINSSLLLHNLLKINVKITQLPSLASSKKCHSTLNNKEKLNHFEIDLINCKWFQDNVKNILNYLKTNKTLHRCIAIQGRKGSGKTTLCKYISNTVSRAPFNYLYFVINCQSFISKTATTIYDQLKIVYDECIWSSSPSLIILENIDLLLENKSFTIDPSLQLYHSQIIEVLKDIFSYVWANNANWIYTIVTSTISLEDLPSLFHCVDEHGYFNSFFQIKPHSIKVYFQI